MAQDNQVRVLNRRSYYDGDVIFHEGDTGSQAFVVQQGRVRIVRTVEGGEKATLGIIEAGGIFGEMALIDKSTRMASAIADGTCVCISIPEETVRKKLKACDPVVRTVILMMIRMIRTVADETRLPPDTVDALTREVTEETVP
ncbi:cyclic nucleotide-binding domain-containing protein [Marivibrio halodurans]|uniref:Cyclic nucleotide-binding domain-containing protein n=1 Tax=Marivibrio halodurans TaxID=2039722 RepID=A0A8J7S513_9PROT|nr:cyclic nucleotide-binding domain-containing protein [Marivibrio halodurans]MBP5855727.1 cyclic nucleotide-binding domain-containing protein [Marivibrio halodurans]